MKINRKIQNIGLIVMACLGLVGLILGSFFDQKITGKIGDFNNLFGILFTALGPVLCLTFGVLAGALLFFMPKNENKKFDIGFRILGAVAVVGFVFSQIKEGIDYVDFPRMQAEKSTYIVLVLVLIALLDLTVILFSRVWVKTIDEKALVVICCLIIAIILLYFVGGEIIKYLASRPRPRVLDEGRLYFKQWYDWKPFAAFSDEYDDCKSFVSGHTANAATLITILPLVAALPKKENSNMIQIISIVIGSVFTLVVAVSRIVARAHWLSDVSGGIILSVAIQALVINLAPLVIKKLTKSA